MLSEEVVEELISHAAAMDKPDTNAQLFERLRGYEVFFPAKWEGDGEEGPPLSVPLMVTPSGHNAMVVFSSKGDVRLPKPFGGAKWEHALEILVKMPQADGLLLTNKAGARIAVSKQRAAELLGGMKLEPTAQVRTRR